MWKLFHQHSPNIYWFGVSLCMKGMKVDKAIVPVVRAMNRNSMIRASHESLPEGGCMVELSMGDGVGEVISLRLLAAGEEQAKKMEEKFHAEAEAFYNRVVEILSEE